ncbi:MAG: hypothetical protein IJV83_01300 [Clostridia bacterium]|nr:hypothetical protein [Clostridia bacterium]
MKNYTNNRKKKFLALCLSALMASSVAAMAACSEETIISSDSSSSEETETSTITDKGLIKNAGFETFDTNDGLNVIGMSVSGWSKSLYSDGTNNSPTNQADSGIIDTSAWDKFVGSYYVSDLNAPAGELATAFETANKTIEELSEADAIANWENFTVRDKLKYYEVWKEANKDGKISEDFAEYENFNSGNLALIDVPDAARIKNPGTHHSESEKGSDFSDYNVLMIHNKNPKSDDEAVVGAAQKYTSSSTVTIQAGAAAEISVWVKTAGLVSSTSAGEEQEAVDKGAYINLSQTVGGTSLPAYEVKNINTEYTVTDNNGWAQYKFFINGSSYASTTVTLTLGLGQGTTANQTELVNGFAFFDDIQCNVFSQEDFYKNKNDGEGVINENGKVDLTVNEVLTSSVDKVPGFAATKKEKTVDVLKTADDENSVAGAGKSTFVIDYYGEFEDADDVINKLVSTDKTDCLTKNDKGQSSMNGKNPAPTLEGGKDGSYDLIKVFKDVNDLKSFGQATETASTEDYVKKISDNYFKEVEFPGENNPVLFMMSTKGVAYTVKSDYDFKFQDSDNKSVDYLAVSFFVRTSKMNGFTGAGVSLVDSESKTSFTAIDTSNITPVNIGESEDIYDGWQRCLFFVKNDSGNKDATFYLEFTFGPTTIDEASTPDSFKPGFAAFTNFQVLPLSEQEYESASADTYTKLVTVKADDSIVAAGNSGFDSAREISSTHAKIEDGLAATLNYEGVYSNNDYITGKYAGNANFNTYANAGLLNRKYFTGEGDNESYYKDIDAAWMDGIKEIAKKNGVTDLDDADAVWKAAFGNATQPLFIWNDGADKVNSYGYMGSSVTIAADEYKAISVNVRVGSLNNQTATARIYLIDTSDSLNTKPLTISSNRVYWYDKKGNVCTETPVNNASAEIAFLLQDNGLYIANEEWSGYEATMANKYFANLEAYEEVTVDGAKYKVLAANGGTHSYRSDFVKVNSEKRTIAFYEKDGAYFADSTFETQVYDFATTSIQSRYEAQQQDLYAEVSSADCLNDEWVTVTFYVRAGSTEKNYRLEVWSGGREANMANPENTYVMFDGNPSVSSAAKTNYTNLLEKHKDNSDVANKSVFSYFDTDKFLRYNKDLDTDGVGNLYKDNYNPTKQEEDVYYMYLPQVKGEGEDSKIKNKTYLVNYAIQDQVVKAEIDTDDSNSDTDDDVTVTTDNETNPLLLASSIVIAIVLLLVIASIIIRKILKKANKTIGIKLRKQKKSKSKKTKTKAVAKEESAEVIDEDSPYND